MRKPEEVNEYPGFYRIPGFSLYAISTDGQVVNTFTGEKFNGSPTADGYHAFGIQNDDGRKQSISRHRALMLTFENPGSLARFLQVNHINGKKGDDRLDNLEWVTPQENVLHAWMIGNLPLPQKLMARNVDSGEIVFYNSLTECWKDLDLSRDTVLYRLSKGPQKVYPERRQYMRGHDPDFEWPIPEDVDKSIEDFGTKKSVLVRHAISHEVKKFDSLSDAAGYLKVSLPAVSLWAREEGQPVFPGLIQIKMSSDSAPWRNSIDPYLELANRSHNHGRPIKAVCEKTGEILLFETAAACADHFGLKKTALNWRLQTQGQHVFKDGYRFGYYPWEINSNE